MGGKSWIAALGLCVAASGACSGDAEPSRSAILITLDTTRLDALGIFAGQQGVTPHLDRLAEGSLRYGRARTVAPLTLPSHASMFTGLYPPRHGVRGNGPAVLPASAETVAERARSAGFQTAGFVACLALDRGLGAAQGFETWSQPRPRAGRESGQISDRPASEVVREALHWLGRRDPTRPFFLWVHCFDPHAPYEAPARFRNVESPYLAEVAAMDAALGQLIEALEGEDILDEAFLAVVADHGEGLGEHGEDTHGLQLWDSTMRVPLFLRYPDGYGAGEVSRELVSVVDLGPTLFDAMDLGVPAGLDGLSLYYQSVPTDRGVYFESYEGWRRHGWSPLTGWADTNGKLIHGARDALYSIAEDPGEASDLLAAGGQLPPRYLEGLRAVGSRPVLEHENDRAVGEEILLEMARLGYGATHERTPPFPAPDERWDRPDPRESLAELADLGRAHDLVQAGAHAAAIPILEGVRIQNAYNTQALDLMATALIALADHERAVEVLRERLTLPPEQIATHRDLVRCFTVLGDEGNARLHSIRSLELLVETHERRGEKELAIHYRTLLNSVRETADE